jgi:hypothetical protein
MKPPVDDPAATAIKTHHIQALMTTIAASASSESPVLSIRPIWFGCLETTKPVKNTTGVEQYNAKGVVHALLAMGFTWAVYNFSKAHFSSTIQSANLPFSIRVGCDTTQRGRSLFNEFAPSATVFQNGTEFLNHIRSSGDRSVLSGYLINTYCFARWR